MITKLMLGAWLSEESMAMREEVCEILPFILTLSNQTFETQKLTKVLVKPRSSFSPDTLNYAFSACSSEKVKVGFWRVKHLLATVHLPLVFTPF